MRTALLSLLVASSEALSTSTQWTRSAVLRAAGGVTAGSISNAAQAIPPFPTQQLETQSKGAPSPPILYTPPAVRTQSSEDAIALAKHLRQRGAKLYGAYWCSHCFDQKEAFGVQGARVLTYIECAADGYQSQRPLCSAKQIRGYPTWEIEVRYCPPTTQTARTAARSPSPDHTQIFHAKHGCTCAVFVAETEMLSVA
jgi:hypothetical protein